MAKITTNAQMAMGFVNDPDFIEVKKDKPIEAKEGEIYLIGHINGDEIWVDPFMSWNDNRIIKDENL